MPDLRRIPHVTVQLLLVLFTLFVYEFGESPQACWTGNTPVSDLTGLATSLSPQRLLGCCWDGPVQIYTLNCNANQHNGQGFPAAHHPIFINAVVKFELGKAHVYSEISPAEAPLPAAQSIGASLLSCCQWGCLRERDLCFLKPEEGVLSIWILFWGLLSIC